MNTPRSPHDPRSLPFAMQTESDYQACAARLKSLADPERLKIINALFRGDRSVSALVEELHLPMEKVSHHLGVLRHAQVVQTRKQGKFVIYSLAPEITTASTPDDHVRTIDLGCCKLDILQPHPPKPVTDGQKKGIAEKRTR